MSKGRRGWELSRQFDAEGVADESETMPELKRLVHEKGASERVAEQVERLLRRCSN